MKVKRQLSGILSPAEGMETEPLEGVSTAGSEPPRVASEERGLGETERHRESIREPPREEIFARPFPVDLPTRKVNGVIPDTEYMV